MARVRAATLKDVAGVDDPAVVKQRLERAAELERAEEERKKAAMTETQRLQTDLETERQQRIAAESRAQALEEGQTVAQLDGELKALSKEHIKEKYFRMAAGDFAEHMAATYTEEQIEAMNDAQKNKVVNDFFAQYAKDHPEIAAKAPAAPPPPPATTQKVPLQNGVTNPKGRKADAQPPPVIQSGPFAGKTAAPGHPNSMTAAEFREWKRVTGNNF